MRLIDKDVLIKQITKEFGGVDLSNAICIIDVYQNCINNAPVVEITEEMAIDKLHETGWMQAHDKAMTETPYGCYASIQRAYKEGKYKGFMMNPYGED